MLEMLEAGSEILQGWAGALMTQNSTMGNIMFLVPAGGSGILQTHVTNKEKLL